MGEEGKCNIFKNCVSQFCYVLIKSEEEKYLLTILGGMFKIIENLFRKCIAHFDQV